jgi:hypothetical protein
MVLPRPINDSQNLKPIATSTVAHHHNFTRHVGAEESTVGMGSRDPAGQGAQAPSIATLLISASFMHSFHFPPIR